MHILPTYNLSVQIRLFLFIFISKLNKTDKVMEALALTTLSYSPFTVFIFDTNQVEASQFLIFLSRGFLYCSCLNTVVVETVRRWANNLD